MKEELEDRISIRAMRRGGRGRRKKDETNRESDVSSVVCRDGVMDGSVRRK